MYTWGREGKDIIPGVVVVAGCCYPELRSYALLSATRDLLSQGLRLMLSPVHSSNQIQAHLYQSFLSGATSDVSLRCTGSWSAVYSLHRVVLIQAGFFRSLFTNGWKESSRIDSPVDTIQLRFDDPNITRAGGFFWRIIALDKHCP